jgi:excisionase family DNA binding protein
MTVTEAAAALGITEQSVRHRIRAGHLRGRRVGARLWLIPRAEVERAKAAGRLRPGPKRKET